MSRLRAVARPLLNRRGVSTVVGQPALEQVPLASTLSTSPLLETGAVDAPASDSLSEWDAMKEARRRHQLLMDQFGSLGSQQTRENTFQPHHPLHRPVAPNSLTLSALMAAGAHLGHSSSLLRPAFLPYAYGTRAGITIIDLDQTLPLLRRAANVTRAVARNNGSILFVGTQEPLRPAVIKAAQRMGRNAYQLSTRWKPGTLTNALQVFGEDVMNETNHIPDLVVLLNPLDNMVLIKECCAKHVPTIALIDSNVDPRIVTYPIPANDDSVRTAELIVGMLSLAGKQGLRELDAAPKAVEDSSSS
ncbi:37S ribosomal protein, mitochondrial [Tulasnella sp. 424]|nr:37S ribosomal protein, mitochondrial [Tulasnella sp. 424]KAG8978455.1 37S ribosomal protein, mitochondrial [Tulasnella sp. 425]